MHFCVSTSRLKKKNTFYKVKIIIPSFENMRTIFHSMTMTLITKKKKKNLN
jgi:hypothetical protein